VTSASSADEHLHNIQAVRRKVEHELKLNISVAELSPLHQQRLLYIPRMPPLLRGAFRVVFGDRTSAAYDVEEIEKRFPKLFGQPVVKIVPNSGGPVTIGKKLRIGVVLSGGPAPGGHNVISGLFDHLHERNKDSELIGFVNGPSGIIDCNYNILTSQSIDPFRNQGGFHLLGSGRTKIETEEQFAMAREAAKKCELDGLVFVGGDDTNTNAMLLAEDFKAYNIDTKVIGVPKTIDGDLRNTYIETSFGFDTAVKVYSELVANLGYDASSAKKSYHFCRLMGRSASHITLETALQTHPNMAVIGEEVEANRQSLLSVVSDIADLVVERSKLGKDFGVIIIPEGLVEFMPDMNKLISCLNDHLASNGSSSNDPTEAVKMLESPERELFNSLPAEFQTQLLLDRDPHGNVRLSQTESERLLITMTKSELKKRPDYKGKFSAISHFFGYEGRCSLPTNFDCNYCYALGHTSAALIEAGCTGYVATVSNLTTLPEQWECGGYPLTVMMNMERRKGKMVPVIKKALISLEDPAFKIYAKQRDAWRLTEDYRCPGPIQHSGNMSEELNFTLVANSEMSN